MTYGQLLIGSALVIRLWVYLQKKRRAANPPAEPNRRRAVIVRNTLIVVVLAAGFWILTHAPQFARLMATPIGA